MKLSPPMRRALKLLFIHDGLERWLDSKTWTPDGTYPPADVSWPTTHTINALKKRDLVSTTLGDLTIQDVLHGRPPDQQAKLTPKGDDLAKTEIVKNQGLK